MTWSAAAPIVYLPVRGAANSSGAAIGANLLGSTGRSAAPLSFSTPSSPTITSVTAGTGSVTVKWSPPTSWGTTAITSYYVQYSSNSGSTWTIINIRSTNRYYIVSGLSSASTYVFEVAAFNGSGLGTWSLPSSPVTPIGSVTVPSAPSVAGLAAGVGTVQVSWNAPTSNGGAVITAYAVQFSSNTGSTWTNATTSAASSPFLVSGLASGSSYVFEVAATNSVGTGPWSAQSSAIGSLAALSVPGAPSITSVTPGLGTVQVAWSVPTSNGGASITGYSVRYSTNAGSTWSMATTNVVASPFVVTGLSSASSYVFEVSAANSVGPGPWSAPSGSVNPLGVSTVPGAPTITGATPGSGSVQVSWNPPASNGGSAITSYSLRYSSNGGGAWTNVTTHPSSSPFVVGGLASVSSYVFEVAATNLVGTGAWSVQSSSVTPLTSSNGIQYHGGPVMVNTVHIYEIWYGNWSTSSTPARQWLVDTFLRGIGGTPYFNTNSSYYDSSGVHVQNNVSVVKSVMTTGKTTISAYDVAGIVASAISTFSIPVDPNGVYFVFTAANITVNGFLTQFCGFHSAMQVSASIVQYAFVGDPSGPSIGNCAAQTRSSPNNDPAGDAMVSVVAHELSEATTDPQLSAWYTDVNGEENGDLCAWNFGKYNLIWNDSYANVSWSYGGRVYQYLIQQNWVNASGGYCALSY